MNRIIAGLAGASLLVAAASPAAAREHNRHHHDHVDAGDVVAGAVVVGGLAALFSAIGNGNQAKQDAAVEACSREAEARIGGHVAGIARVGKSKGYYTVEGSLDAEQGARAPFSCTIRNGTIYGFRTGDEA